MCVGALHAEDTGGLQERPRCGWAWVDEGPRGRSEMGDLRSVGHWEVRGGGRSNHSVHADSVSKRQKVFGEMC